MTKNSNIYITAVLPAHNEEQRIPDALNSIRSHVDNIIVACDNCNDNTALEAKKAGADIIFNTVNNHNRKAGALNQALKYYVNWKIRNQYLLMMDADTVVVKPARWFDKATNLVYPNRSRLSRKADKMGIIKRNTLKIFHRRRYRQLFSNKAYDCVGSIFQAPEKLKDSTNIEECQRLEWEAYQSKIERSRKVFVLTGTCSLISARIMQRVYALHDYKYFYDIDSVTEDFAMTVSVKEADARLISPTDCQCITATKSTIKDLISQRRRWYLGALQLVSWHRVNKITLPYIGQQLMLFISVFAFLLFLIVSGYLYLVGSVDFTILWVIIFLGFDVDQTIRVWKHGSWFDRIYSISIVGCLIYSFLLQISYLWALESLVDNRKVYWNNKERGEN